MKSMKVLGVEVDAVSMKEALDVVWNLIGAPEAKCAYVVTPNLDHARMLQENEALRSAYDDAALRLVDGMPLVWAARMLGRPVPERVAGSDLVPALLASASADRPLTYYLLGAAEGIAERASQILAQRYPHARCVGFHSPPFGFERNEAENQRIAELVSAAAPDVLVLGLGAPKQELWVHANRHRLRAKVALCVGATIDFIAGQSSRAPLWMQKTGLEWVHRAATDPKRLLPRYAKDAVAFPKLLYADFREKR